MSRRTHNALVAAVVLPELGEGYCFKWDVRQKKRKKEKKVCLRLDWNLFFF